MKIIYFRSNNEKANYLNGVCLQNNALQRDLEGQKIWTQNHKYEHEGKWNHDPHCVAQSGVSCWWNWSIVYMVQFWSPYISHDALASKIAQQTLENKCVDTWRRVGQLGTVLSGVKKNMWWSGGWHASAQRFFSLVGVLGGIISEQGFVHLQKVPSHLLCKWMNVSATLYHISLAISSCLKNY